MDTIADKLANQITSIRRWSGPSIVLITFSDGSQAGFDASNDKKPIPNGEGTSLARQFATNTKTIRSGKRGPEVVFHDDSIIVCGGENWTAMPPE